MDLLTSFTEYIAGEKLFSPGDKLLVAVSGGLDSVVLCELCHRAGFDFVMVHCNFQLRGAESQRDEEFVKRLFTKYGKTVMVERFDTQEYAARKKVSVQVAARELRYKWFERILAHRAEDQADQAGGGETPPVRILTAHHLDDNIETLLMNLFRGTGIDGLHGILPRQGNIVRPLLWAWKEDLRRFAEDNGLEWVEDSSNSSDKYTRNYFRHHIIPLVSQLVPGALQNLAGNIPRLREAGELYDQAVRGHLSRLLEVRDGEVRIPVLKLKKTNPMPAIIYEIIKDFGFSPPQVGETIALLDSGSGRYIQSATHRIVRHRGWLIIAPRHSAEARTIAIGAVEENPVYENGVLVLQLVTTGDGMGLPGGRKEDGLPGRHAGKEQPGAGAGPGPLLEKADAGGSDKSIAWLDADMIQFPLLLRKWRPGDYFYPLGMRKKKKLARFLIDNKLSLTDKEKIWVIEMDKKIIWVVGHRIDDRFRITPQTKQVLKIESRLA